MGNRGFTLIELIVIMAMIAALAGLVTINLFASQQRSSLVQVTDTLVADLESQQTKAMTGITANGAIPFGYGIYFDNNRYILFSGASYNATNPSNSVVPVDSPVTIGSVGFSGRTVLFASVSGELPGYVTGADTVRLQNTGGQTKIIRMNRYGVIISVQ
jgi:prepilin-type N-terminal cleavage/methylation domain-containing protein